MAEELDVEAMLEAPYRKEEAQPGKEAQRSRDRKRSRSRERKRSRSREKRRSRERRSSRERGEIQRTPPTTLAARIRPRDLEDFFSAVGKASSVPLAIGPDGAKAAGSSHHRAGLTGGEEPRGGRRRQQLAPCREQQPDHTAIETIQLMMDSETGRSKGNGFITFLGAECAQKAVDQLDGFELAGRPMKVSHVTERSDNDDMQLMARLAEAAMNPLNMNPLLPAQPLATHCFQLSHMFNSCSGEIPGWETDIQHDVIEECRKHGGVVHIYIDKKSAEGNVYVKCPTLFPESAYATHLLAPPPRR
ncbi:hypothetical protein F7725_016289 [Dissostichus mawsoni]|uniref:RRM domain-containing protein n=1 Tax=Dissostichus mawsoni TaxID=36200 RepID=A0A7J5Z1N0_DISMA|nr:hypothetical protein F7725_016289 [Dissostichus mawsoni]